MNNKKYSGSYYTPYLIAEFIIKHIAGVLNEQRNLSIFEPSVGDGVFLEALNKCKAINRKDRFSILSIDKNGSELEKAKKHSYINSRSDARYRFECANFLEWQKRNTQKFSCIIGNPPYVRRGLLHNEHVKTCNKIHEELGLTNHSVKNIWVTFLLKNIALLNDEGVLAMVLPAELLQSEFSSLIREFLAAQCARIEVFTFNELIFKSIGQDTIILICYKLHNDKGIYFANVRNDTELTKRKFRLVTKTKFEQSKFKWTHHTLTSEEVDVLQRIQLRLKNIETYCTSKPGIVTAANKFFIITPSVEAEFDLTKFSHPIIQKGLYVGQSVTFTDSDFEALNQASRPSRFLKFTTNTNEDTSIKVKEYLELGVKDDIPSRYKCSKRPVWYVVPNIPDISHGFFFKRLHEFPKLVKNAAKVYATDSAYLVNTKADYNINSLIYSFYNSLSLTFCELLGRYYGGGVLELTPKEFKSIPVPYTEITDSTFRIFEERFRNEASVSKLIEENDTRILIGTLGLDPTTVSKIQSIRKNLTNKRLRRS